MLLHVNSDSSDCIDHINTKSYKTCDPHTKLVRIIYLSELIQLIINSVPNIYLGQYPQV